MNCTAWNSVVAKALRKRPSAIPRSAFATAISTTAQTGPAVSSPSNPNATRRRDRRLHGRDGGKGEPVAPSRSPFAIGIDISRSSVPLVRSRSIAIEVTRNIEVNGKMPTSGPPTRSNVSGCPSKT